MTLTYTHRGDPLGGSVDRPTPLTLFWEPLMSVTAKLRILRVSGYRCQFSEVSGSFCGAPAANVAHPSPPPDPEPLIAVCDHHLAVLYAKVS